MYGSVDKLYGAKAWRISGEGKDGVVIAQAVFNMLEVLGYGIYLYLVIRASGGVGAVSHSISSSVNSAGGSGSGSGSGRERSASLRSGSTKAAKAAKSAARNDWVKPVRGGTARWAVMIGFATAVVTVSKTMMYGELT